MDHHKRHHHHPSPFNAPPGDIEKHKPIAITIDIAILVTACMAIVMLLIPEH